MQKLRSLLTWRVILVVLITLISYGQTSLMYFWQDDSALLFKLQNPEGLAGSFGKGIVGSGAYKWLVTPFVPFYPLFGKQPFGYFLVGFITYLFATYCFYRFVSKLFKDIEVAYVSTLVFAAGYIGSEIMFRVINSWQTNLGLILAFVMFEHFVVFCQTKRIRSYFLALLFYWAATEFVFIRSHSLIIPIIALDVFFRTNFKKISSIRNLVLRQIPFVVIFYFRYLTDQGFGGPGLVSMAKEIIAGKFEVLAPFLADIGNVFVPSKIQTLILSHVPISLEDTRVITVSLIGAIVGFVFFYLFVKPRRARQILTYALFAVIGIFINVYLYDVYSLAYRTIPAVFSGGLGIQLILAIILSWFYERKTNSGISKILLWGLVFVATQVFGYFIQYPTAIFSTTHRYYSYALIGYSVIIASTYLLVKKNYSPISAYLMVFGVLGMHLYLGFSYQNHLVRERSIPSARFYSSLQEYVPSIEKNSAFYFDVSRTPPFPQQFTDSFSVGSMPESTALAMYYDVDRYEVYYLTDFNEMISKIVDNEFPLEKLYTFYLGKDGLIDTSQLTRKLLRTGSVSSSFSTLDSIRGNPLTPQKLEFDLSLRKGVAPEKFVPIDIPLIKKKRLLEYLSSKNEYYDAVDVVSDSEWKYREVENVADNDANSVWQGHRIYWADHKHEELTVDLGRVTNIGAVVWKNWKASLAPRSYTIQSSLDGVGWSDLLEVPDGPERSDGELVREDVPITSVRYVRMVITKTETNDSPALTEFEVVLAEYAVVDFALANSLYSDPLSIASDNAQWSELYNYGAKIAVGTLTWSTNKKDVLHETLNFPLIIDNKSHRYELYLPAGGTEMNSFSLSYSVPVDATLNNISMSNMGIDELNDKGLIVHYSNN